MRGGLVVITVLILALLPAADARAGIIPAVNLTLSPTSASITSSPNGSSPVSFTGNVTLDKLPYERITVKLVGSVNAGWQASVSPDTMVITDKLPHSFGCTVIVPEHQPSITGTLAVNATAVGGGFSVTSSVTATIIVTGVPLYNGTANNQTANNQTARNQTTGSASQSGGSGKPGGGLGDSLLIMTAVVLALAVAGVVTIMAVRKRKAARVFSVSEIEESKP